MKVVFFFAAKDREKDVADSFLTGCRIHGDQAVAIQKTKWDKLPEGDAYCVVGVKSLDLVAKIKKEGKPYIFLDKGYFRHRLKGGMWEYWRVAVNDHHPTAYVAKARHQSARWLRTSERRAIFPKPWRDDGIQVVFAGSSQKYHAFAGLPDPTAYAEVAIGQLKQITKRPVIYRPKPTWDDASPIKGTTFSGQNRNISQELMHAWCLVTNGSNSCFDAICAGIPCIVLGNAIGGPISSRNLEQIKNPYLASDVERNQWLANLAWCQFTEAEMQAGLCWQAIRPQIFGKIFDDTASEVAIDASPPSKAQLKKAGLWKKDRPKRSKEEQRASRPFSKKRVKVGEWPE